MMERLLSLHEHALEPTDRTNTDGSLMEKPEWDRRTGARRRPGPPLRLQNAAETPPRSEMSPVYRRLQPPKGFLLFLVLCLLGRRVMTSLPLLEFWLHVLLLVVLKTPFKEKRNQQCVTLAEVKKT